MKDIVEPLGCGKLEELVLLQGIRSQRQKRADRGPTRQKHLRLEACNAETNNMSRNKNATPPGNRITFQGGESW